MSCHFQPSNPLGWVSWYPAPISGCGPNQPLTKDILMALLTKEIPRVLGAQWQTLDKDQICIFYSKSQGHCGSACDQTEHVIPGSSGRIFTVYISVMSFFLALISTRVDISSILLSSCFLAWEMRKMMLFIIPNSPSLKSPPHSQVSTLVLEMRPSLVQPEVRWRKGDRAG